jgi:hypothetical protein
MNHSTQAGVASFLKDTDERFEERKSESALDTGLKGVEACLYPNAEFLHRDKANEEPTRNSA